MSPKPGTISESTIARMAGNILSGMATRLHQTVLQDPDRAGMHTESAVRAAVRLARELAAEVRRTSPQAGDDQ